ncbi:hypothetical protein DERF_005863 [Dermatophagoides farinae]|uniref:Uncharacterized protein n=1 Tax=Dermatophagoides farinae TaxID=6954 RepID=A0A922I7S5_DERFA|nr:hypothetical protein DERF_005863 [Dermatophagoides farinae]
MEKNCDTVKNILCIVFSSSSGDDVVCHEMTILYFLDHHHWHNGEFVLPILNNIKLHIKGSWL